jgi:carbonic anhydrase
MDFRIGNPIFNYLEKEGILGDCDITSIAGGVKDKTFLMNQLGLSISLHKTEEAILCNHTDCGAYSETGKFSSFEKECSFHIEELKKAKELVSAEYPSLRVKLLLGKILPSKEVTFEEV